MKLVIFFLLLLKNETVLDFLCQYFHCDRFLFDFFFQSLNKTFFTPTDLVKFVFSKKFLLNKKKRALKLISSDLIALKTETITPRKQTWQLFKTKGERE